MASQLNHFAYCGNIRRVTELLGDGRKADDLNEDNNNESALHSCARGGRENATKVATLLLNSISNDARSQFVNLEDSLGKTAIYYAVECSAEKLVAFLLEEGSTIPPEEQKVSKCNSLTHLAATNGNAKILKHLIGSGFPPCTIQDGETPLQICAQQEDTQNYADCVEFLASVYTGAEVNFRRTSPSDRKTAVHLLSENCSSKMLKALLSRNKKLSLLVKDANKKIPLELAVEACRNKKSEECVDLLMKAGVAGSDIEKPIFLELFSADQSERSPLDAAIQHRSSKTVAAIVTNLSDRKNWIDSSGTKCKQHLANIYRVTPEALPPLMTQCLELSIDGESVEADFGPLTGYSEDTIQTKNLNTILRNKSKRTRKSVLLHPLVQLYIEQRWGQLSYLNWISLGLRVTWLILYTILVLVNFDSGSTCNSGEDAHRDILSWLNPGFACYEAVRLTLGVVFLITTVLLGFNEILTFIYDWWSLISYLKLANVFLAFITSIGCLLESPHVIFFNTAAFGFLLAFLLVFQEFAKRGYTEIAAFGKVVYRTCFLSIFVVVVLFAFRIAFKILLPSLKDQLDGAVQGFVKVLVLMTGEYDYKDIFHEGGQTTPSGASLLFFLFVIIGTIALSNLLTAFAVDDTERLMREARFYITETRLEQIYKWEVLQNWAEQKGVRLFNALFKGNNWRESGELVIIPIEDCENLLGGETENILNKQQTGRNSTSAMNGQKTGNEDAETKC